MFQITDPSGKILLSSDASKCRVVRVANGVIVARRDITFSGNTPNLPPIDHADGVDDSCHIDDDPAHPTSPGVAGGSGQHDANTDVDHGPPAIVVQMMPFEDTPNPGGVYKAWMTPLDVYLAGTKKSAGKLKADPKPFSNGQRRQHECPADCFQPDPGFSPPRSEVKTDNFKVKEFLPPVITVRKFYDLDEDGVWDFKDDLANPNREPEIGEDVCITAGGALIACGTGGWPYDFFSHGNVNPVQHFTPDTHVPGMVGIYEACEETLAAAGWTQTAAYLDDSANLNTRCVSVEILGTTAGETHEIVFGNFLPPDVTVAKSADNSPISAGETASFTITVTNDGPGIAIGVTLEEITLPAGVDWSTDNVDCNIAALILGCDFGTLDNGGSFDVVISGVTDSADCGSLFNLVEVGASNEPDTAPANTNNRDDATITVLCPDVTVDKDAVNAIVNAGENASFDIIVTNNGPGTAFGVTLTDMLPSVSGTWALSGTNESDCSIAGDGVSLSCRFGDMASGASKTFTVSTTTDPADCPVSGTFDLDNTATVDATNEPNTPAFTANNSDSATITVNCPDVTVDKDAVNAIVNAGENASFDITVTNLGPGTAFGVTLSDTLPSVSGTWGLSGTDAGDCTLVGLALDCDFGDILAPDILLPDINSRSITVSVVTVAADCDNDDGTVDLDNTAVVAATNEPGTATGNNEDSATITVNCPDLVVEKTAGDSLILGGTDASFTITVTNLGPGDAFDVTLDDTLPGTGWAENPDTLCTINVGADDVLDCDIGTLANGASFSVTVERDTTVAECGSVLNNTATASASNEPGGASDNNSDSATITIACEGCTPGYWKQEQHFGSWTNPPYNPLSTLFSDLEAFERVITIDEEQSGTKTNPTLLEALGANGGEINALARHGTAALLNAASTSVTFPFTVAEVILLVQAAIDSNNAATILAAHLQLAGANEGLLGCPLSLAPL